MLNAIILFLVSVVAFGAAACGGTDPVSADINKPLAQAEVISQADLARINAIVRDFSREHQFAVQEIVSNGRGRTDFSTRLFRDDISVTINRIRGDPIKVAAFPLCACERERLMGLQEAADAAVRDLRRALSDA